MLFDIHQVVFELSRSWGGEGTGVPDFPCLHVVFEGGEGVNKEAQYICVALEHLWEKEVPLPVRELHLWLPLKLFQVLIPWKALLRGVIGRGERLVVGMLEQPLVQPFGVTGQVVREHVERSAQWQRPLAHVHIEDCLANISSGDVEDPCLFAPDPRGVVTVVTPPVNDAFLHSLVVTDIWMCHPTMDAGPAVTLPGVRFQHQR